MKFCITVLLALLLLYGAQADDGAGCPQQFDPPANLSTQIKFPMSATNDFPANFDCTYQINVPRGYSAYVVLNAKPTINITGSPIVQVVDFNQRVENFAFAQNEQFWFVSPGGKIKLSTQTTTVSFQFTVQWYTNITSRSHTFANVTVLDTQPLVMDNGFFVVAQVAAITRVSVIALPPNNGRNFGPYLNGMRSILIFDGPNENSTCLGTAYQLLKGDRQYVSTGDTVTVVPLQPVDYGSQYKLIFQDFENTKEILQYKGVGCQGPCDSVVMDASKAASAFSTYSAFGFAYECLLGVSGSGMLDVYYGGKTESKTNLMASYNVSNMPPNVFPQLLRGVVRTYVLTGGIATVNVSYNSWDCPFFQNDAQGFVTSREYKTNLTLPYQQDWINYGSKGLFYYTLNVQDVDLSQNKTLQLIVENNRTRVLNVIYNSTNPPTLNSVVSGVGNIMEIKYYAEYEAKKGGYYISYTASKVNFSSSNSYYFLIFVVLSLIF